MEWWHWVAPLILYGIGVLHHLAAYRCVDEARRREHQARKSEEDFCRRLRAYHEGIALLQYGAHEEGFEKITEAYR